MTFDPYAWPKALHVAAAITFVAVVLGVALFLATVPMGSVERAISARVAGVVRAFVWMCRMGHPCPETAGQRWNR